jgi:hypothetical protein
MDGVVIPLSLSTSAIFFSVRILVILLSLLTHATFTMARGVSAEGIYIIPEGK